MDVQHGETRITTTIDSGRKLGDFFEIHKDRMTRRQRQVHQIRIKKYLSEPYLLSGLAALCFPSCWAFLFRRRITRTI